jgi:glucokinase
MTRTEPATAVLAVDIGGTKIAAAVVDAEGALRRHTTAATPRTDDAESVWRAVRAVMAEAAGGTSDRLTVRAVGVSCAGPMTWPTGRVSPLNIPAWREFPLLARLGRAHPKAVIRLHNDGVCATIGEHWRGAGRDHDNLLGVVVSTGVGGGLVLGGRLVNGGTGNAGHVGHVTVEPDGPRCPCGRNGCLEAVAAGPAIVSYARRHGWRAPSGATARDVAQAATGGEPAAVAAFARAGRSLGNVIASTTHLCDLDLAIVGGGLAQAADLLFAPLRAELAAQTHMAFARRLRVVPAILGPAASLLGAAALILQPDRYWPRAVNGSIATQPRRGRRATLPSGTHV